MNKHTPGPWHIGMKPGPMIYGPKGEQVANMDNPMLDTRENLCNVGLIAAAPDLLAMLERLLSRCKNLDQSSTHEGLQNCQSIADARALIAKIKGE